MDFTKYLKLYGIFAESLITQFACNIDVVTYMGTIYTYCTLDIFGYCTFI